MICKFCSAELADNAAFCHVCGKKLDESEEQAKLMEELAEEELAEEEVLEEECEEEIEEAVFGKPAKKEKKEKKQGKGTWKKVLAIVGVAVLAHRSVEG